LIGNEEIFMCARFQAKEEKLDELRSRLLQMVEFTSQEEGCLFYNLHIDRNDPTVFYFLEGWKNSAALAFHDQTPYVQAIIQDALELTIDGIKVNFMSKIS
jgi:quinol monooxygenase YgiN